ncbi:transcription antitermination factor NusB [candidate division KSB1 bacterium]|nr:transcription antitermination factor NusB [candidate division KSB1 bacterium]RQW02690.1 MAG: transcription antitermination factor NusB [candidate division KSB1 bacterium]
MFNKDFKCIPPESRHDARETALQVLYALELSQNSLSVVFKDLMPKCENPPPAFIYAKKLIETTFQERNKFDAYIRSHSANWRYDRIAIIDLIILRIAICEFIHFSDVPTKVTIDEALELAKRFSTQKSSMYINGMLDVVLVDLNEKKLVAKSGRGTLDKQSKKKNDRKPGKPKSRSK